MKRVIVTGAGGFIGSLLVRSLIEKGIQVTAIDRSIPDSLLPASRLLTTVLADASSLSGRLEQDAYDAFYHLAWKGVNGLEKCDPSVQLSNVALSLECAKIARAIRVKRFLCAGTVAENVTDSLSHLDRIPGGALYGISKRACRLMIEGFCKSFGLRLVWMQFGNIYGVGNRTGNLVSYTLERIFSGQDAEFGPAAQPYDFVHVKDLIEAVCRLGDCELTKTSYYIGSGNVMPLKDYLIRIGALAGRPERICIGRRPDDGIRYCPEMFDVSDLKDAVGSFVSVDFDQGVREMIAWLRTQRKDDNDSPVSI